ncbi:MAG: sulfotransferase family 2 domain-containing protein [Elainellaceae cyanobacterium]|uniref:sulfotransferase family 2 domain-containing protein n=1 Tax=Leptolyngbya sp. CCY15150 TaxID=2767772 RepID=UPI0019514FEB|nr:sulfotransferase family 2 domain-containing protein [Leptolyngbya sp. CCY15150]
MLSQDDLLYFIHIPKTAGTTLISLLDAKFDVNEIFPAQLWKELAKIPPDQIGKYRFYRGHFGANGLKSLLPKEPVCLTMLRQPIPLALSTYKFVLREPGTRVHSLAKSSQMSFADFVSHPKTCTRISNKQTRNLSFDIHSAPPNDPVFHYNESRDRVDQWLEKYRITYSDSESLERAKQKLDDCAFFGLVERFNESMALMSYTFGWSPVGTTSKLREATSKAEIDALPTDVRDMLEDYNELDTLLYSYADAAFQERLSAMIQHLHDFAKPGEPRPETWDEDPETMQTLLDRHYTDCQKQRQIPPSEVIRVDFAHALSGSGWHHREKVAVDQTYFRWTGPSTTSTLDVPLSQQADVRVTFRIINAVESGIIDSLSLSVNDTHVALALLDGKGTVVRTYQAVVPKELLESDRPFTRFTFQVAQTRSPRDQEAWQSDMRQLGVALHWMDIHPVEMTDDHPIPPLTQYKNVATVRDLKRLRHRLRRRDRLKYLIKTTPGLRSLYSVYKRMTAR